MKKWFLENKDGFITLEFTNHCNLNCVMCDTGKIPKQQRHHLNFELYKKIIDEIASSRFDAGTLVPFWLGEPLLNPRFFEMVEYASKKLARKGIRFEIHTNATFLSPTLSKRLLELDTNIIKRIILSLDAVTSATYTKIRRNGNFKAVINNIKHFIEQRHQLNKREPLLVFQFIVMQQNLDEKESFIEFWGGYLEKYNLPLVVVYSESNYPDDKDCVFIRKLDTSYLYSQDASALHSLAVTPTIPLEKPQYFNVILPYYRLRNKIPSKVYQFLSEIPNKLLQRCKTFLDLNVPNADYSKQQLAELIDEKTRLNIGFSSANNFDNLLDIFYQLKQIDPLVKNIMIFDGNLNKVPSSPFVDGYLALESSFWHKITSELAEQEEQLPSQEVRRVLLVMPKIFFKGDHQALKQGIQSFLKAREILSKNYTCTTIDLNLSKIPLSQLKRLAKEQDIVIIYNKKLETNAVELGKHLGNKNIFYWDEWFEKSYKLWPLLRTLPNFFYSEKTSPKISLSALVVSPPLFNLKRFPVELLAHEAHIVSSLKRQEVTVEYFNANTTNETKLNSLLKNNHFDIIILPHYLGIKSDTFNYIQKLKQKKPGVRLIVEEHSKKRVKPTSYKQGVDLVVHNIDWASIPKELLFYDASLKKGVWRLDNKQSYYSLEFEIPGKVCKIISGKESITSIPQLAIYLSLLPSLFESLPKRAVFFVPKLYTANVDLEALRLDESVVDLVGSLIKCRKLDLNITPIDKTTFDITSNLFIVSNHRISNNCFEIASELKRQYPRAKLVVLEHSLSRLHETASKPEVDLAVYAKCDLRSVFTSLTSPKLYTIPGVAFKYGRNIIINPHIDDKKSKSEKPLTKEVHKESKPIEQRFLVLGPKLFTLKSFPETELGLEATLYRSLNEYYEAYYLNHNFVDYETIKEFVSKKSIGFVIIPHHVTPNYAFILAKKLKADCPQLTVIIYEPRLKEIKAAVLKEGVDIVLHNLSKEGISGLINCFNSDYKFFLKDIAYKYGDNVIINPKSVEKEIISNEKYHPEQLIGEMLPRAKGATLIVPRFYTAYPSVVYQIARELYDSINGLGYYDGNFVTVKPSESLNVGIWVEDCPSNLMELFEKAKSKNKSAKNIVVYMGCDKSKAKQIFVNPTVDLFVYYTNNASIILADLLDGKLSQNILDKMVYKYGNNIINSDLNPLPFKIKKQKFNTTKYAFLNSMIVDYHIIRLDPLEWSVSKWDDYGPAIWQGDEQYADGLALVFGINHGFFEYRFDCPNPSTKKIELYAKVCSHSHRQKRKPENASELTLEINSIELETRLVYFEPNRSDFVESWVIKDTKKLGLKPKNNSLVFRVKKHAKYKTGLTIYGKSLTKTYKHIELPIVICFKK